MLARSYADPVETEQFTTDATPDLLIVVNLRGAFRIESRRGADWIVAPYLPGSLGMTAPGASPTLRWRGASSTSPRSLHLFLAADLLRSTADDLDGAAHLDGLPDALLLNDPALLAVSLALGRALRSRRNALHADSLAQALAGRVLSGRLPSGRDAWAGGLRPGALQRVIDYMQDHLADDVALDALAAQTHVSTFHFARIFKQSTGQTPYRYLVALRMGRATRLLASTALPVQSVAAACGYESHSRFTQVFGSSFGVTPTQYRRAASR